MRLIHVKKAVLVTKYVYEEGIDLPNMYLGIADVVQCVLIMLR